MEDVSHFFSNGENCTNIQHIVPRRRRMEEQCILEEEERVAPAWYEVFAFRILNGVMVLCNLSCFISGFPNALQKVMFFLAATVKLQEDDNACLWIPTFLVPAFLSTIVAVCFVMVFVFDFVNVIVFAWMLSSTLNLSLSWSIKHLYIYKRKVYILY